MIANPPRACRRSSRELVYLSMAYSNTITRPAGMIGDHEAATLADHLNPDQSSIYEATRILDYDKRLRRAVELHQAGNLRDAEVLYRAILKVRPDHPDANHNLGVLAGQTRRFEVGLPYLEKAYGSKRQHGQYALSYAKGLLATGQAASALEVIEQAILEGLDTPVSQTLRQAILARLADLSATPDSPSETQERALIASFNAGRHAEVESVAGQLIAQHPDTGYAWKLLGAALLAQRKEALAALENAVRLLPDDAHTHNNLGNVLNERGHHQDAVASYHRALRYGRTSPRRTTTLAMR